MSASRREVLEAVSALCAAAVCACAKAATLDEGAARKARSIALLRAKGISYLQGLPQLETSAEVHLRSQDEIIQRSVCLFGVALAAADNDLESARKVLGAWGADLSLSPNERRFLAARPLPEAARADFSWRFEAVVPLLWALGWLEALPFPSVPVDPQSLKQLFDAGPGRNPTRLRDVGDILDQTDLIYRLDWALVEVRVGRPAKVPDLNPDVVPERHRALNWLIRYGDEDWDDVTADT